MLEEEIETSRAAIPVGTLATVAELKSVYKLMVGAHFEHLLEIKVYCSFPFLCVTNLDCQ
jgi:hypothetical protein